MSKTILVSIGLYFNSEKLKYLKIIGFSGKRDIILTFGSNMIKHWKSFDFKGIYLIVIIAVVIITDITDYCLTFNFYLQKA